MSDWDFKPDLLTTLNIAHMVHGEYPSFTELWNDYPEMGKEEFIELLKSCETALDSRGCPSVVRHYESEWTPRKQIKPVKNGGLDPFFVVAVNEICSTTDKRSTNAKLKAIGITPQKWTALLRDKKHKAFFDKQWNASWGDVNTQAQISLVRNVESGDLASIKHVQELTGVYQPNAEMTINLGIVIAKLMELLATKLSAEDLIEVADSMELIISQPKELTA